MTDPASYLGEPDVVSTFSDITGSFYTRGAALAAVQRALAAQPVLYSPIATRAQIDGKHPNDNEARDPARAEYLRIRGDDEGQGLCDYWKWGHAAGWNDHARHVAAAPAGQAAPQQAAPAVVVQSERERDACAPDADFEHWWAKHMPARTQSGAWAEWCAIRSNCQPKSEAAPAGQAAAPPDGTLHADGYFTWAEGKRPAYVLDKGLPAKFWLQAPAAEAVQPDMAGALQAIMRAADKMKEPCGMDPESPAAIRNGKFATIAHMAAQGLGLVRGPAFEAVQPPAQAVRTDEAPQ